MLVINSLVIIYELETEAKLVFICKCNNILLHLISLFRIPIQALP